MSEVGGQSWGPETLGSALTLVRVKIELNVGHLVGVCRELENYLVWKNSYTRNQKCSRSVGMTVVEENKSSFFFFNIQRRLHNK